VARRGISDDLVSDIPGLAAITNPELLTSTATSPFWIISEQVTNVTDSTNVSKVTTVDPPSGDVSIPTMGSDPQKWPIEAFTLSLLALASTTPETPWRPALMFERYPHPWLRSIATVGSALVPLHPVVLSLLDAGEERWSS
jgi:hypothetical protein